MKRLLLHFFLPLMAVWGLFGACVDVEQYDNNPRGNFEALWRIIDEHYCFFDYKKQAYGLDWNAVYAKYAPQFHDGMSLKTGTLTSMRPSMLGATGRGKKIIHPILVRAC